MLDILLCVLAADLITGAVHWWEDCYGLPDWPLIGPAVIEPNIEHHLTPETLTLGTFWSRNYQTMTLATAVLALAYLAGWWSWQLHLAVSLSSIGNELHAYLHMPRSKTPRWALWMQDAGILQTRRQHAQHHKAPYTRYYCTITNLTNEVLESIGFWRRLERSIEWTTGIAPKRMSAARRGV